MTVGGEIYIYWEFSMF